MGLKDRPRKPGPDTINNPPTPTLYVSVRRHPDGGFSFVEGPSWDPGEVDVLSHAWPTVAEAQKAAEQQHPGSTVQIHADCNPDPSEVLRVPEPQLSKLLWALEELATNVAERQVAWGPNDVEPPNDDDLLDAIEEATANVKSVLQGEFDPYG